MSALSFKDEYPLLKKDILRKKRKKYSKQSLAAVKDQLYSKK